MDSFNNKKTIRELYFFNTPSIWCNTTSQLINNKYAYGRKKILNSIPNQFYIAAKLIDRQHEIYEEIYSGVKFQSVNLGNHSFVSEGTEMEEVTINDNVILAYNSPFTHKEQVEVVNKGVFIAIKCNEFPCKIDFNADTRTLYEDVKALVYVVENKQLICNMMYEIDQIAKKMHIDDYEQSKSLHSNLLVELKKYTDLLENMLEEKRLIKK